MAPSEEQKISCMREEGGVQITAHEPLAAQRNKKKITALDRADRALCSHHISAFLSLSLSFFIYIFPSIVIFCLNVLSFIPPHSAGFSFCPSRIPGLRIISKSKVNIVRFINNTKTIKLFPVFSNILFMFKAMIINFQSCCYQ